MLCNSQINKLFNFYWKTYPNDIKICLYMIYQQQCNQVIEFSLTPLQSFNCTEWILLARSGLSANHPKWSQHNAAWIPAMHQKHSARVTQLENGSLGEWGRGLRSESSRIKAGVKEEKSWRAASRDGRLCRGHLIWQFEQQGYSLKMTPCARHRQEMARDKR